MSIDLAQLPASAANAVLTFLGIISPRRRLRAEIMADKELQKLFAEDSEAYRMLDARTTFDVALLTEHLVPADKKKTNWSSAFIGFMLMVVFAWWTWRLHEAHSGWQWLTGFIAFTGFASMMGSRTPVQPPAGSATTEELPDASERRPADEEESLGHEPTVLGPRRAS
jgi:hypothetical protein